MARPARPIRLVVSDVDGTLLRDDHSLAPSTIAAAARLRAAGVRLAVVSSRPPAGLEMLRGPLALDTPRAGFNGGAIVAPDDTVLEEHPIREAACRDAVASLEAAGTDVWLFVAGEWLLKNSATPLVAHERRATHMQFRQVDDFSPFLARTLKVMGTSADTSLIGGLEDRLRTRIGAAATVARSQPFYLDVTSAEANKGTAARSLARLLGVALEAMACLGDMPNDLPMLAAAGFAIAMGNAPDEVKARADAVTGGNNDDGWARAIDRYVLGAG